MDLRRRKVTLEDEPFLLRLYISTREEEVAAWGWAPQQIETFMRLQFTAQSRSYAATYRGADHFLLMLDGEPVGRMIIARSECVICLVDISLLPEHRCKGIGSILLRELQEECKSSSGSIQLRVLRNNPAIHLYARSGFRRTGGNGLYEEMEWNSSGD
jgi:ribosomal protein S18 acetylase RimI-like enzyme